MFGSTDVEPRIGWAGVITVYEIKSLLICDALPESVRPDLSDRVPAHMGDFKCATVMIALPGLKSDDASLEEA